MMGIQNAKLQVVLALGLYFTSVDCASAITSAEMKNAMARQVCPADAVEVNFLAYKDRCGPPPDGASSRYLQCQNSVDAENKVISDYNEFIRRCNQGRVGSTKTSPDLSQRYRSQQSITKQSEEQGTAQKYQEKIKEEENKEAQEAGADDLAAKRKQLNADQARQKANQAAEKANADAERQPSIMPSATPTSPRVVLESRGFPGSQYYALQRGNPDCVKQNGLNVCTLQTAIDPALTGGKCFDAHLTSSGGRLGTQYCLNRSGSWAGINDGNTSSYQFCVDVICAPDH